MKACQLSRVERDPRDSIPLPGRPWRSEGRRAATRLVPDSIRFAQDDEDEHGGHSSRLSLASF
jgi:hypothetical protein